MALSYKRVKMIKKYAQYINLTEEQCQKRIGPPMVDFKKAAWFHAVLNISVVVLMTFLYMQSDVPKLKEFIVFVGVFCGGLFSILFALLVWIEYDKMKASFSPLFASSLEKAIVLCNECESCDEYRLSVLKNGRKLKNFDINNMQEIYEESEKLRAESVCKKIHGIA